MVHKKHSSDRKDHEKQEATADILEQSPPEQGCEGSKAEEAVACADGNTQADGQDPKRVVDFMQILKERDEFLEHLQRMKAEFDNYRKRVQREREDLVKSANSELIADLLEIVDNLHRALDAAQETGEQRGSLAQGVEMTAQMLFGVLSARGLKPIPGLGEPFDPTVHEAVSTEVRPEIQPGIVVQEWQKGYWLGDKVIRPAKVVVSAAAPSQSNTD